VKRTYDETVEFLFSRLPVFQRDGAAAYKPGLENILAFCEAIGNPHHQLRTIHVGGTNGKGSTSHSLASILQEQGYKTGLYTSPHLVDFRERIQINGVFIPKEFVVDTIESWIPIIDAIEPSFFELTVALCFHYFSIEKVEITVIEVGMGGRLDSTNIITPLLSVITNIGYDHQKFLGNTLPEIAKEKAGIIKSGVPVVISERQAETEKIFERKAEECGSSILFGDDQIHVSDLGIKDGTREIRTTQKGNPGEQEWNLSLQGQYQLKNIKGILTAIIELRHAGIEISQLSIQRGLSAVQKNTGLRGRWQVLQQQPMIVCDTGHNVDGVREVVEQIQTYTYRKLWLIWGMVNDKDHHEILQLLPTNASVIATQPHLLRALPSGEMKELFTSLGFDAIEKTSVQDALEHVCKVADKEDFIFIGGSTFVVAEIPFELFTESV